MLTIKPFIRDVKKKKIEIFCSGVLRDKIIGNNLLLFFPYILLIILLSLFYFFIFFFPPHPPSQEASLFQPCSHGSVPPHKTDEISHCGEIPLSRKSNQHHHSPNLSASPSSLPSSLGAGSLGSLPGGVQMYGEVEGRWESFPGDARFSV